MQPFHCIIGCAYSQTRTQLKSLTDLIKSFQIRVLNLAAVSKFTVDDYREVLYYRTDLREVILPGLLISHEMLGDMLRTSTNLSKICMWCSSQGGMTNEQIEHLFTTTSNNLASLSIQFHPTLTTEAVNAILLANPQIVEFSFDRCPLVDTCQLARRNATNLQMVVG